MFTDLRICSCYKNLKSFPSQECYNHDHLLQIRQDRDFVAKPSYRQELITRVGFLVSGRHNTVELQIRLHKCFFKKQSLDNE